MFVFAVAFTSTALAFTVAFSAITAVLSLLVTATATVPVSCVWVWSPFLLSSPFSNSPLIVRGSEVSMSVGTSKK